MEIYRDPWEVLRARRASRLLRVVVSHHPRLISLICLVTRRLPRTSLLSLISHLPLIAIASSHTPISHPSFTATSPPHLRTERLNATINRYTCLLASTHTSALAKAFAFCHPPSREQGARKVLAILALKTRNPPPSSPVLSSSFFFLLSFVF